MVSIVMPVYNVELYIEECLKSIFNQTYNDIQLIIVNDGSTDKTELIIKKFEKQGYKFVYLTQENSGAGIARNLGLKYAKGEYVIFIDADDYISSNMIEKMYTKAILTNSDIVVCGYNVFLDSNSDIIKINKLLYIEEEVVTNVDAMNMFFNGKLTGFLWDKMFKLDFLRKYKFRFENRKYIEDAFPVFRQISKSNQIAFVKENLYSHRQTSTSTMKNIKEELLVDYEYSTSKILNYVKDKNLKIKKSNIKTFQIQCFNIIIYYYYQLNDNNIYSKFNNSIYKKRNIKTKNLIYSKDIKVILNIVLWKCKLYHWFKK